jgi:hypothetical protein
MRKLSQTRIVAFLKGQARPLEQKLYAYHFEGGSVTDVLTELACFQNPDGGFGHALEPDVRLPGSSVIATTIAFQRFREIHAPADHPVVANGCRYLRDTYDASSMNWPIIPPNVDDAPHAPWWTYGGDLSRSLLNPRAEILGYLYDYPGYFPAAMRQRATDAIVDHLMAQPDKMPMHDLLCAGRLYETASLPEPIKTQLWDKLKCVAEQVVTRDPAQWAEYGLQPLGIASGPDSPFAVLFRRELDVNLDFMIDQLTDPGCWTPNWSWYGLSPDVWLSDGWNRAHGYTSSSRQNVRLALHPLTPSPWEKGNSATLRVGFKRRPYREEKDRLTDNR